MSVNQIEPRRNSGFTRSLDAFSRLLYHELGFLNSSNNLICSPFSIQTCAAMLRMGVEDGCETAQELDAGLHLSSSSMQSIAEGFELAITALEQCSVLKMANKVYIMQGYQILPEFNTLLTEKFHCPAENIDFSQSQKAADSINGWVESRTNKLIQNLVSPGILDGATRLVLINAIHFKGEWSIKFDEGATHNEDFFLADGNKLEVPMMNASHKYYYADLPDLDAKALRLDYRDTDLYMLIILPNNNGALTELESKLQSTPLDGIISEMAQHEVHLKLPKFKTECSQELTPLFKKLGILRIFSNQAEFGKMFQMQQQNLEVSKIIHKAFIDVNEVGTEAAAATAIMVFMKSAPARKPEPKIFHANHPFYYTICDDSFGPIFVGNLKIPVVNENKDTLTCYCTK